MTKELRFISADLRAVEISGKKKLQGYAVRYNARSTHYIAPGMRERIAPKSFARSLRSAKDVRLLYEHSDANLLARTSAGNLRLRDTDEGLLFDADLPDTTLANDLYEQIRSGNVRGMSFGFVVNQDSFAPEFDEDENGDEIDERCQVRTVHDADLIELSAVSQPCYEQSTVLARSTFQFVTPEVRAAAQFKNELKEKEIPRAQLLDRFRGEWV